MPHIKQFNVKNNFFLKIFFKKKNTTYSGTVNCFYLKFYSPHTYLDTPVINAVDTCVRVI